jgi:hypothetical protein
MGPLGILELINGHSPSHQLTAENTDYEKHAACGDRATSLKIQLRSASGSLSPPGSHTSFALAQNVGKLIRDLAGPTQPSVATQPISASASTGS